jgi:hypothetical protein
MVSPAWDEGAGSDRIDRVVEVQDAQRPGSRRIESLGPPSGMRAGPFAHIRSNYGWAKSSPGVEPTAPSGLAPEEDC